MLREEKNPLWEKAEEQMQSNQGFSLMEMLLCVLLSSIVISAIGGFMVTSIKQYNHVDREVNLQIETQTTLNQLSKMIKEADNVQYAADGNGGSYAVIYSNLERTLAGGNPATAAKIKIVWFCADADPNKPGKMYLFDTNDISSYSAAMAEIGTNTPTTGNLLADYVYGFDVKSANGTGLGSGLGSDQNSVNITLDLKNVFKTDEKTYTATDTIKLRNRVVAIP